MTLLLAIVCLLMLGYAAGRVIDLPLSPPDYSLEEMLANDSQHLPKDSTSSTCLIFRCESAFDTDIGSFMKFSTEKEAVFWQLVLGDDSRRNGRLLVNFSGLDLTLQEKVAVVQKIMPNLDLY